MRNYNVCLWYALIIMPPPLIGGGIKRCFCLTSVWRMTSFCLSRTSGLSREQERPRKTKITTSHVSRIPLSRSKGQRSRSPGRFTHRHVGASGRCSGGRWNMLTVRNCFYFAVCSAARGTSAPTGEERCGGHIVAAACLQLVDNIHT